MGRGLAHPPEPEVKRLEDPFDKWFFILWVLWTAIAVTSFVVGIWAIIKLVGWVTAA